MHDVMMPLPIEDIVVADGRREVDPAVVKRLADSIDSIGLRHPITVRKKGEKYILVAGRHRMEAFKKLEREHIPSCIVSMTNAEARMWEIAENLHRAELTKLQRADNIAEWVQLCEEQRAKDISAQVAPKSGRPESGMNAASRELGIERTDVQRSVQIAGMSDEAKDAAHEAGIDDNQSKLLAVAKEEPSKQVAKVIELAAAPLNHFETQEQWLAAMMRVWNKGSKEWREEFLSRIEQPVMDARHG